MTFQVKLYIQPDNEIRRFVLEANANFDVLQQQVKRLTGRDFRFFWKDNEEDHIVLSSEEEFHTARQSIDRNGLLRLYAKPGKSGREQDESSTHGHVTCDGCQGIVAGTRYKCLECPDYDLCETCEQKRTHSEHDMLVIRRPRTCEWKKLFAQGYGARGGRRCHGPATFCGGPMRPGPCGPPPPGPPAGGPCGQGRRGPPCGFMPPFLRQMMQNLGQTVEMDIDMTKSLPEIIAEVTQKIQEAISVNQNGQQQQQQQQEQKTETDKKEDSNETTVQPATENDAIIANATAITEAVNAVADMVSESFVSLENDSRAPSEAGDGWTHLQAEAPEGETTVEPAMEDTKTTVKPTTNEAQSQQVGNRIEAALKAMEEMGFPNEGNLLRRLLENHNGDISRVLDQIK